MGEESEKQKSWLVGSSCSASWPADGPKPTDSISDSLTTVLCDLSWRAVVGFFVCCYPPPPPPPLPFSPCGQFAPWRPWPDCGIQHNVALAPSRLPGREQPFNTYFWMNDSSMIKAISTRHTFFSVSFLFFLWVCVGGGRGVYLASFVFLYFLEEVNWSLGKSSPG